MNTRGELELSFGLVAPKIGFSCEPHLNFWARNGCEKVRSKNSRWEKGEGKWMLQSRKVKIALKQSGNLAFLSTVVQTLDNWLS